MENLVGQKLKGYQVIEKLREGGFGAIYRAEEAVSSEYAREVAIKVILPKWANQADFIRRFEFEAETIARLEHPHIIPIHAYWRDPSGAYLVMRYMRGGSVHDVLANERPSLDRVLQLINQIVPALDLAHRNNVIHRDLKPQNFLLDEDGNIYLADFGIAKDLSNVTKMNTETGAVMGSYPYMSPEQFRGEPVTHHSDIYSLGVVLHELIAGEHPYSGDSLGTVVDKHLNHPLPWIEDIDNAVKQGVNDVIQAATAKTLHERYADILSFGQAFGKALHPEQVTVQSYAEKLSLREHEILQFIADGLKNREIASHLFISVSTVKWHIKRIYKKLGVQNRTQAKIRAIELGHLIGKDDYEIATLPDFIDAPAVTNLDNPYKGLQAFQTSDSGNFFGRDDLISRLINRLGENDPLARFLAIIGPSGSGKSSVVKAGFVPAIWKGELPGSERWFVAEMIPGVHPVSELAIALTRIATNDNQSLLKILNEDELGLVHAVQAILPDDDTELLLIVDQFEEVFTQVEHAATRSHFLDLLRIATTDARSRIRIIITLRADYYDRPLHFPEFGRLLRARSETILPMTIGELEQAIIRPAQQLGMSFEAGLSAQIAAEIHEQAGALPLMQFALMELFNMREGHLITHDTYRQTGGVAGALSARADDLLSQLTDEGRELTRQIFLRLVSLGEGVEDTRRRTLRSELEALTQDEDSFDEIIETFAEHRLLSLDTQPGTQDATVEVAHEAILQVWTTLHHWISESREELRLQRQVAMDAGLWYQTKRDDSYLATGSKLIVYEEWAKTTSLRLTNHELAFLDACLNMQDQFTKQKEEQKAHEEEQILRQLELERQAARSNRRARNNLMVLVGVLVMAAAGAVALAGFGLFQAERARDAQSTGEAVSQALIEEQANTIREANIIQSLALTFQGEQALNDNPLLALSLAVEANRIDDPPREAQNLLFMASTLSPIRHVFDIIGDNYQMEHTSYSPDGQWVITISDSPRVFRWNLTGDELAWSTPAPGSVRDLDIRSDSLQIVITTRLTIWSIDASSGEIESIFSRATHWEDEVYAIAYSPDGQYLAASMADHGIVIFDVETKEVVREWSVDQIVTHIKYSPDGNYLLIGANANANNLVLWDVETGTTIRSFVGLDGNITAIDMSSDGQWIVAGDDMSDSAAVWHISLDTAWHRLTIGGVTGSVYDVQFSPDGRQIAVANDFPRLSLWSISEHSIDLQQIVWQDRFSDWLGEPHSIDYSPNGQYLIASGGEQAYLLDVSSAPIIERSTLALSDTNNLGSGIINFVSPTQNVINALRWPSPEILIDSETFEVYRDIQQGQSIEGQFLIYNFRSGDATLTINNSTVEGYAISTDGNQLAYVESDRPILTDLVSGEIIRHFDPPSSNTNGVNSLQFNATGDVLFAGTGIGQILKWDATDGDLIDIFSGHSSNIRDIVTSPNPHHILSTSDDRTAILWNSTTGEIRHRLTAHRATIEHANFNSNGTFVLTANEVDGVIIWDIETGLPIQRIQSDTAEYPIVAATFDSDGSILTFDRAGIVTRWQLIPNTVSWLVWTMNNRFLPDLPCEIREAYLLNPPCNSLGHPPRLTPFPTPVASATPLTYLETGIVPLNTPMILPTLTPTPTPDPETTVTISGFIRHSASPNSFINIAACGDWSDINPDTNLSNCINTRPDENGFFEIPGVPKVVNSWLHIFPEADTLLANRNIWLGSLVDDVTMDVELVEGNRFRGLFYIAEGDCCENGFGLIVEVIDANYIYPDEQWVQVDVGHDGRFDAILPPGIYRMCMQSCDPDDVQDELYQLEPFVIDLRDGDVTGLRIPLEMVGN